MKKTLADAYLEEADELLNRGEVEEASEKYYKAAEEAIKVLSFKSSIKVTQNGHGVLSQSSR
ncbi:hypothetical protein HS5_05950 [Acidianus sp. HS-5]|nr:hypothetical protein HS5_05950 [Acidianus sp. HS-5]